jgi:hypothetical protein
MQSSAGCEHLRPARPEDARIAMPGEPFDCKRCIAGPFIGMRGCIESIREDGLVVVRFDAASPFGAMVRTGVFDARNLRKAEDRANSTWRS